MKKLKSISKKWSFVRQFLNIKHSKNDTSARLILINRDTNDIHMFI